ncbi:MAG: hypothetical protein ACLPOO_19860 [Terriglobales bacterium]
MFSWENPDDRVAIVQMNGELRHAQLELLSAQCATHQLRLRFSTDDLARYGQPEVLRKAIAAASDLNDYYASIEKLIPREAAGANAGGATLDQEQILEATTRVLAYLREQRTRYYAGGEPLSAAHKAVMRPFFSPGILDRVRVVELGGARITNPPFYSDAKARGFVNLPQITHMPSLTFIDVVVFNERITERALFHGLVHAVQFQILGPDRYTLAFVDGFLRTNSHFTVPLEAHTFALESKFVQSPAEGFSVEEQVRGWVRERRY